MMHKVFEVITSAELGMIPSGSPVVWFRKMAFPTLNLINFTDRLKNRGWYPLDAGEFGELGRCLVHRVP
jgi:hypothetical protein